MVFFESAFRDKGITALEMEFQPKQCETTAIKIFGQALPRTDGEYITKQIVMIRDFAEVNSSQKLMKELDDKKKDDENVFYEGESYLLDYYCILKDVAKRQKPTIFIDYYDVIHNTDKVLSALRGFIGCGRFDLAESIINKDMYRHKKSEINQYEDAFIKYLYDFKEQMKNGSIFQKKNLEQLDTIATELLKKIKGRKPTIVLEPEKVTDPKKVDKKVEISTFEDKK